ncbi:CD109 antigen [Patella vulgata]|uniref:CD109 antigen n=1 Tax=Patella vulgata TaxID=6465 RepID=UPI0024A84AD3|nr:CD109 antigen [Patella vulgata]
MLRLMVILGLCGVLGATRNTYLITAPSVIVRGEEYNVGVHILNASAPVQVRAQIVEIVYNGTKQTRNVRNGNRQMFKQGVPGSLTLKLPRNAVAARTYRLKIRATKGLQLEMEQNIRVHNQQVSTLVQTDKAMYKGRQTVQFRVLTIFPDLKPYKGKLNIDVIDARGNRVKQWLNEHDQFGVVSKDFQLSDQPQSGEWSIKVTIPDLDAYTTSQHFTVQEYELPKFEVIVELPPYGLRTETELHGTVKAKYTFGKDVEGMVDLRAYKGSIRNSCGREERYLQQVFPINGEAKFTLSTADLKKISSQWSDLYSVNIVARVTEENTGKVLNGTESITFHSKPYKLSFLSTSANTFKPGLPYTAYVKLTTQDDVPVMNSTRGIEVFTCVDFTRTVSNQDRYACSQFQGTYNLPTQSLIPSNDGVAKIAIEEVPRNTTQIKMRAWYNDISVDLFIYAASSPSKNFLQISTFVDGSVSKIDRTVKFEIRSTEAIGTLYYIIKARGSVQKSEQYDMQNTTNAILNLPVTPSMSPSAYILVYYMRKNGEVVADGLTFNTDRLFKNKVSVDFNKEAVSPQDRISLIVSAEPKSQVYLLAVDQSVLLVKSGNDLTPQKVKSALSSFSNVPNPIDEPVWHYGRQSSAKNAKEFFKEAGVLLMTDIQFLKEYQQRESRRQYDSPPYDSYGGEAGYPGPPGRGPVSISLESTAFTEGLVEPERVRNIFPETWLWTNETVGADGRVSIEATAPDTITSWVASGFGVHNKLGLGVADATSKVLVEKSFFVSLNLPPSVKYGEVVTIQAIVFNYLDQDVPVKVTLPKSADYTNIEISRNGEESDTSEEQSSTLLVEKDSTTSVYFPIRPKTRGMIDIKVTASSFIAADAVRRQLKVTPEGIRRETNHNLLIKSTRSGSYQGRLSLDRPRDVVPDTMKIRITATGDLMGLSLDNFDNLIQLPTGCGEQNLMKFAPVVFIADYLKASNQMEDNIKAKIIETLELGYQKQLSYQRYDKSYGPFGDSDGAGSIWLTASVVRSFQQAKEYIYIDDTTTADSVRWILDRQNLDGSFTEQGTIIDKKLQGNPVSLTSYVLIALLDVESYLLETHNPGYTDMRHVYKLGNATQKATQYLEDHARREKDVYNMAILALALTKAKSEQADDALIRVANELESDGNMKYLDVDEEKESAIPYYKHVIDSHDIIATSYLLLTYVERREIETGYAVMKAVVSRRNGQGGFQSSQDTVVALEALSRYATISRPADLNLDITVTNNQGTDQVQLNINNNNALVIQSTQVKWADDYLNVVASGSGVGYLDINVEYYVTVQDVNENFDVSTVLLDDNINGFTLMTCCKVLDDEPTGMTTATIQIPAGFSPDLSSINVAGVRRVEGIGDNVNVYFDQIGKTSTCFNLQASRRSMVSSTQKCFIKFTDYYKPSKSTTVSYEPRRLKESTVCDVCTKCCNSS